MINIQSNKVKAKLSEVLRKVEAGQEIAITRHGKIIAKLCPCQDEQNMDKKKQAVQNMKNFNKVTIDQSISKMRETGRR